MARTRPSSANGCIDRQCWQIATTTRSISPQKHAGGDQSQQDDHGRLYRKRLVGHGGIALEWTSPEMRLEANIIRDLAVHLQVSNQ
jgi:hypothetical protein